MVYRKLSRTTAHRHLLLRNMVTSLLEHEQIKTTLPKAREAARMAEKVITLGKDATPASRLKASGLLLNPNLLPKLFGPLAQRYADRQGGYTRIHKYGNRPGDNAPTAILEFVDNPRDLRYELTSRAIGWELLSQKLKRKTPVQLANKGFPDTVEAIEQERSLDIMSKEGVLRSKTRWNLQKVLKFRSPSARVDLGKKVSEYMDHLLATSVLDTLKPKTDTKHKPWYPRRPQQPLPPPGQKYLGQARRPSLSVSR